MTRGDSKVNGAADAGAGVCYTDGVIHPGAGRRLSHILTDTTLTPGEVQTH